LFGQYFSLVLRQVTGINISDKGYIFGQSMQTIRVEESITGKTRVFRRHYQFRLRRIEVWTLITTARTA